MIPGPAVQSCPMQWQNSWTKLKFGIRRFLGTFSTAKRELLLDLGVSKLHSLLILVVC